MINPPTDSLYKFMSIIGIVILLWGATFPWQKSYEYNLEEANLTSMVQGLGDKQEYLEYRLFSFHDQIKNLKQINPPDQKELRSLDTKVYELNIEIIEIENKIKTKVETMKVLKGALSIYKIIGWCSIILGILLVVCGFYYWYVKVQKHIDAEVISSN